MTRRVSPLFYLVVLAVLVGLFVLFVDWYSETENVTMLCLCE